MPLDASKFDVKVDRRGPHHLWLGATSSGGVGQIRVDGKLHNATRLAWELARGPLPDGALVLSCPEAAACVRVEHLRLSIRKAKPASKPTTHGTGTITERSPGVWKVGVNAGVDEQGHRRRVFRTVRGSRSAASKELAAFASETGDGSHLPSRAQKTFTVNDLVEWYLVFAREERGLEHSSLVGYAHAYDHWLKDVIGSIAAHKLQAADLDKAFGIMRRAGLSHSRMNNGRAVLSGAYKWGKRHRKVNVNPVDRFELPQSKKAKRETATPEIDELLRLLDGADLHDPELAPVLKLGATTGMRRGELSGLRRDRLRLERGELVVDTAINDAGGVVVEKSTKTKKSRVVSLDPATIAMLREHLAAMDARAGLCRVIVPDDGFVFSLDVLCALPMRPELMTRRMRQLRAKLGIGPGEFDATILALRKWTSSELMDAGFNPSTVSGRQGHTVQVMLHHYSSRRRSADQAAAAHLGERVLGKRRTDSESE